MKSKRRLPWLGAKDLTGQKCQKNFRYKHLSVYYKTGAIFFRYSPIFCESL
jgi:hypothetical protein